MESRSTLKTRAGDAEEALARAQAELAEANALNDADTAMLAAAQRTHERLAAALTAQCLHSAAVAMQLAQIVAKMPHERRVAEPAEALAIELLFSDGGILQPGWAALDGRMCDQELSGMLYAAAERVARECYLMLLEEFTPWEIEVETMYARGAALRARFPSLRGLWPHRWNELVHFGNHDAGREEFDDIPMDDSGFVAWALEALRTENGFRAAIATQCRRKDHHLNDLLAAAGPLGRVIEPLRKLGQQWSQARFEESRP